MHPDPLAARQDIGYEFRMLKISAPPLTKTLAKPWFPSIRAAFEEFEQRLESSSLEREAIPRLAASLNLQRLKEIITADHCFFLLQ